jgi:diaminopimelate decarboxylase
MKKTFVSAAQLEQIAAQYPTPFHIYDEQGIRENARRLNAAFHGIRAFASISR